MTSLIKNTDLSTMLDIERRIKSAYGVDHDQLCSIYRDEKTVHARFILWYLLKTKHSWSSPKIAEAYNRDHTTILSGIERAYILKLDIEAEFLMRQNT